MTINIVEYAGLLEDFVQGRITKEEWCAYCQRLLNEELKVEALKSCPCETDSRVF